MRGAGDYHTSIRPNDDLEIARKCFVPARRVFAVDSNPMAKRSKLRLTIASPCPASWDDMEGDDRVRFCPECELNVYNLSAMTEEKALKLVEEREGRLCVRLYQRRDGTVLTTDCPVGTAKAMPMLGGINEMGP